MINNNHPLRSFTNNMHRLLESPMRHSSHTLTSNAVRTTVCNYSSTRGPHIMRRCMAKYNSNYWLFNAYFTMLHIDNRHKVCLWHREFEFILSNTYAVA